MAELKEELKSRVFKPPAKKTENIVGVNYPVIHCPGCQSNNTQRLPELQKSKDATWWRRKCRICDLTFKEVQGEKN
jgi:hypothetical protein